MGKLFKTIGFIGDVCHKITIIGNEMYYNTDYPESSTTNAQEHNEPTLHNDWRQYRELSTVNNVYFGLPVVNYRYITLLVLQAFLHICLTMKFEY